MKSNAKHQNAPPKKRANSRDKASTAKRRVAPSASPKFRLVPASRGGKMLALRSRLGFNREIFARMLPISTRSLASIEAGSPPSDSVTRRLVEVRRVVEALEEVVQQDAIGDWLKSPNEAFSGLKPLEVIERGEIDRLWQMIFFLRSGALS